MIRYTCGVFCHTFAIFFMIISTNRSNFWSNCNAKLNTDKFTSWQRKKVLRTVMSQRGVQRDSRIWSGKVSFDNEVEKENSPPTRHVNRPSRIVCSFSNLVLRTCWDFNSHNVCQYESLQLYVSVAQCALLCESRVRLSKRYVYYTFNDL